jgi:hypothetical protein
MGLRLVIEVSFVHLPKTLTPYSIALFGRVTEVRAPHSKKTPCPIIVTLLGITIEESPEYTKAPCPIVVTLLGMTIEESLENTKALFPIFVTLLGILIVFI